MTFISFKLDFFFLFGVRPCQRWHLLAFKDLCVFKGGEKLLLKLSYNISDSVQTR